jgi:hypothetical protein
MRAAPPQYATVLYFGEAELIDHPCKNHVVSAFTWKMSSWYNHYRHSSYQAHFCTSMLQSMFLQMTVVGPKEVPNVNCSFVNPQIEL